MGYKKYFTFYEGASSVKSYPSLPNGEVSHLKIDSVDVIAPGDVSFYKFVSSEQDYDFLQFYMMELSRENGQELITLGVLCLFQFLLEYMNLNGNMIKNNMLRRTRLRLVRNKCQLKINIGQTTYQIIRNLTLKYILIQQ